MRIQEFLQNVELTFGREPQAAVITPAPQVARLKAHVNGLATQNILELLRLAGSALDTGEVYLEAGTYEGLSALAALTTPTLRAQLIDDFSMADTHATLLANLGRFDAADRVVVHSGDALDVLLKLTGVLAGLFFYDADHSPTQTLLCLRASRGLLSSDALIVIDDAEWPAVRLAVDRFLEENPEATLLMRLDGMAAGRAEWWHGIDVLYWRSQCRIYDLAH